MTNLFSRVKVLCVLVLMGVGLAAYSATPTVTSLTAQQRYPQNGLVDITMTLQGAAEDVANAECLFAATNGTTKAAIPITRITHNGTDTYADGVWIRRFVWDARADVGAVKIDDVALTVGVRAALPGVQLWENGPYWAECNVGATQPEESGYYFWWGDTVGYKRNAGNNGWISVKDSSSFSFISGNCPTYGKSDSELMSEGYLDSTGNLVAAHDAATAYLGAPWRMPTDAEFSALISNCTTTWTTRNGVNGLLVSGKGAYASKSIFLPAAGYGCNSYLYNLGSFGLYWSTAPHSDGTNHAIYLYSSSSMVMQSGNLRSNGQTVRPLRGFTDEGELVNSLTTILALDCRSLAVTALQCSLRNGLVDITVTLQGTAEDVAKAECLFAATNGTTKSAIPVEHITRNGDDKGSGTVWTRKFIWDAKADVGAVKIDDVALTVDVRAALIGVQLWEDGPFWAECNVGAIKPEESGYYFWWGDTVGYVHDGSKWVACDGSSDNFSFYNYNNENPAIATMRKDDVALKNEGWIGEDGKLTATHDAATAHLGTPWRMPTEAELSALISNCTTTWMTRNGVNGRLVTGKGAYSAKSIFLPAAGFGGEFDLVGFCSNGLYWSSTPYSDYSLDTRYLAFDSDYFGRAHSFRYRGQSVRPVRGFANPSAAVGGVTTHLVLDCRPSVVPTVEGDSGATVTGDAETGYVIRPSEGNTAVEVMIPQSVDAAKVTVEVLPITKTIATRGAKVKIVSRGADITEFLNVPVADGNGVVDLTKATVKEEIVKEAMDPEKGAEVKLNAADPKLTTAKTRVGLFYQLREGETLGGMRDGDSKVGDGEPWTPEIKVKGGKSAFYSIGVGKGE